MQEISVEYVSLGYNQSLDGTEILKAAQEAPLPSSEPTNDDGLTVGGLLALVAASAISIALYSVGV